MIRLDIFRRSFWSHGSNRVFDIRIINPTANTTMKQALDQIYYTNV